MSLWIIECLLCSESASPSLIAIQEHCKRDHGLTDADLMLAIKGSEANGFYWRLVNGGKFMRATKGGAE